MAPTTAPAVLARDAAHEWRRRIATAHSSIVIFSPYLDALVIKLLSQIPLTPQQVVVVTDLSPRAGATDYLPQLRTLRHLLSVGIDVRSLSRLHAKVLLIDDQSLTVGSQNFTRYATKSREVTATPTQSFAGTPTLATLKSWIEEATPVSADFLDRLMEQLADQAVAASQQLVALEQSYLDLLTEFEAARHANGEGAAANTRRPSPGSLTQTRESPIRRADAVAWASIRPRRSPHGPYLALEADREYDLTDWAVNVDDPFDTIQLPWLHMVPVMLTDSRRMGFARVGRQVISIVRTGVRRSERIDIGRLSCALEVTFPEYGTDAHNIEVRITPYWPGLDCIVHMKFDAQRLSVIESRPASDSYRAPGADAFAQACRGFLKRRESQGALVQMAFSGFRFDRVGIKDHNAADFFDAPRYELSVIELHHTPILLARQSS